MRSFLFPLSVSTLLLFGAGSAVASEDRWVTKEVNEGPIEGDLSMNRNWKKFELHWRPRVARQSNITLGEFKAPQVEMRGCNIDVIPFSADILSKDTLKELWANVIPVSKIFAIKLLMNQTVPGIGGTLQSNLEDLNAAIQFAQGSCDVMANFATASAARAMTGKDEGVAGYMAHTLECAANVNPADVPQECKSEMIQGTLESIRKSLKALGAMDDDEALTKMSGSLWENWGAKRLGVWNDDGTLKKGPVWYSVDDAAGEMAECGAGIMRDTVEAAVNRGTPTVAEVASILTMKGVFPTSSANAPIALRYEVGGESGSVYPLADKDSACDGLFGDVREFPLAEWLAYVARLRIEGKQVEEALEMWRDGAGEGYSALRDIARSVGGEHLETAARMLAVRTATRRHSLLLGVINTILQLPTARKDGSFPPNSALLPGVKDRLTQATKTLQGDLASLDRKEEGSLEEWLIKIRAEVEKARKAYRAEARGQAVDQLGTVRAVAARGGVGAGDAGGSGSSQYEEELRIGAR